jgi:hypothetical protein
MATTIKIRDDTKNRLDNIKATLQLKGTKIKQEDLIDLIISIAEAHPMLLESVIEWKIDPQIKKRVMSNTFDLGPSSHETIDEELYK